MGDRKNYRETQRDETRVAITFQRPKPMTESEEKRLKESTTSLQGFNIVGLVTRSLGDNKIVDGLSLDEAVAYAKSVDSSSAFDERNEGASSPQSVIASVAACLIRFGDSQNDDYQWAWGAMARVEAMKEPENVYGAAKIPWHPATRLVIALHHDRRSASPRAKSAERLLKLTLHPLDNVSELPSMPYLLITMSIFAGSRAGSRCISASFVVENSRKADGTRLPTVGPALGASLPHLPRSKGQKADRCQRCPRHG